MREKSFERPNTSKILRLNGIKPPEKITKKFIMEKIDEGVFVPIKNSYREGVEVVDKLPKNSIALFYDKFKKENADYGLKSLEDLLKIDSVQVLRNICGKEYSSSRLTKKFAEQYKILPYTLISTAMEMADIENPPIGYYWIGLDNHVRATTWIRAVVGAEMQIMRQRGDFSGEVLDTRPYGRNLRVRVKSKTQERKDYEFSLFRLPMHYKNDIRMFSEWINISHNSNDPDTSYRGGEHDKRKFPIYIWSATTIYAFYEAMIFVSRNPEWKQFKVNPFPIPTNKEAVDFIDNLRLRSLILKENNGERHLCPLTKTEIDKMIGARTILKGYNSCWHHWGKKDLSYLYTPYE